jgi:fumarate hydratase class II
MTDQMRMEFDSFGPIEVPAHVLWGAQTAGSLRFLAVGEQCILQRSFMHSLGSNGRRPRSTGMRRLDN